MTKEKIINDLKTELININSNSEIGKILYNKSIESGSFNIFIPSIEDVTQLFKDIVYHLEIYLEACKNSYKKHFGYSFEERQNNCDSNNTIIGRGNIEIVKDNNKLRIVLDCE